MGYIFKKTAAVVAGIALSLGTLSVAAAPAQAKEDLPEYPTSGLYAHKAGAGVQKGMWSFGVTYATADGSKVPAGTKVSLVARGCDGRVIPAQKTSSKLFEMWESPVVADGKTPSGIVEVYWQKKSIPIQPLRWEVTFEVPGYAPFTDSGVYSPSGWKCPRYVYNPPNLVSKWSAKKSGMSKAKVGKKVAVTAPKTAKGAQVTYAWKVNGKTVKSGSGKSLKIKKPYAGKKIAVKVIAKKGTGDGTPAKVSRVIRFGKAMR